MDGHVGIGSAGRLGRREAGRCDQPRPAGSSARTARSPRRSTAGLQEFERPDGRLVDLAATDPQRIRERGVPRYNAFRRLMRLSPVASFESLTGDPVLAARLPAVNGDDVESLNLMVGMFAERSVSNGFARPGAGRAGKDSAEGPRVGGKLPEESAKA